MWKTSYYLIMNLFMFTSETFKQNILFFCNATSFISKNFERQKPKKKNKKTLK